MATVDPVAGGTLGAINPAVASAAIFLPSLTAQIDAAIALGLGPAKLDLQAELNGALAAQASLQVQVSNPLALIEEALAAAIQLQASLTAALTLPPVELGISASIGVTAALAGTLTAKLGILDGVISAALAAKTPALSFLASIEAALSAGPAILLAFDGISDATTMANIGSLIAARLASDVTFNVDTIHPTQPVSGILLLATGGATFTAMGTLFAGL